MKYNGDYLTHCAEFEFRRHQDNLLHPSLPPADKLKRSAEEHTELDLCDSKSTSFSLSSSMMVKRILEGPYMFCSLNTSMTFISSSEADDAVELRFG